MKKITVILFLMTVAALCAADIPLIDLSGPTLQHREKTDASLAEDTTLADGEESDADIKDALNAPDIQLRTPAKKDEKPLPQKLALPQQTSQANNANDPQRAQYTTVQGRRLRLFLRELTIIQQAAKKAGGDIRVTIEPVGITPEEMIGPLAAANWFDIKYGQDAIVVKSKDEDPYVARMRDEVANLEQQRKALLSDVQSLERLASDWQSRIRSYQGYQTSTTTQEQPASMQMSYPKTTMAQPQTQQQQMPLQQQPGYQPMPKTVIVNPEYAQQLQQQQQSYNAQRVVVPQQPMYSQQPMAEQPVPRTQIPVNRDLSASTPVSANQQDANNNFSPAGAAMARHYIAQQGQVQMYQPQSVGGESQPQYSSESTVVLAPRGK